MIRSSQIARAWMPVALVLWASVALAQNPPSQTELPELDDLKAPSAPAFVLLGVSPTKVERPQAVKALVLSAVTASGDGFPKNFAVEFTPYWFGSPSLNFADYYRRNVLKDIPRHLSISVATTPLSTAPDSGTALALGFRTLPLPGRAHPRLTGLVASLDKSQVELLELESLFNRPARLLALIREAQALATDGSTAFLQEDPFKTLIDRALTLDDQIRTAEVDQSETQEELDELAGLPVAARGDEAKLKAHLEDLKRQLEARAEDQKALAKEMLDALRRSELSPRLALERDLESLVSRLDAAKQRRIAKAEADLKATALKIQALDTQRVGATLAVAGAVSWDVAADMTEQSQLAKLGIWITPGYRIVRCPKDVKKDCSQPFDVLGVFRYLENRRALEHDQTWELGARLVWQTSSKLAVSGEWLAQTGHDSDEDPGTRLVGVAEYEITSSAFLYASFGRDFEEKGVRRNLVSAIGITVGFGRKPIVTP